MKHPLNYPLGSSWVPCLPTNHPVMSQRACSPLPDPKTSFMISCLTAKQLSSGHGTPKTWRIQGACSRRPSSRTTPRHCPKSQPGRPTKMNFLWKVIPFLVGKGFKFEEIQTPNQAWNLAADLWQQVPMSEHRPVGHCAEVPLRRHTMPWSGSTPCNQVTNID